MQKFERSAALHQGTDLRIDESVLPFIQHIADNVDHDLRTLNGLGTFHGMGIMVAITPKTKVPPKYLPRISVNSQDIIEVGNIERHYYNYRGKNSLKHHALNVNTSNIKANIIDVFWQCWCLLQYERP